MKFKKCFTFLVIYALPCILFFLSIAGIVYLVSKQDNAHGVENTSSDNALLAKRTVSHNSLNISAFSSPDLSNRYSGELLKINAESTAMNSRTYLWLLLTLSSLSFLFVCVAGPVQLYVDYKKPARQLSDSIQQERMKEEFTEFPAKEMNVLSKQINNLLLSQQAAELFFERVSKGQIDTITEGIPQNRYSNYFQLVQRRLTEIKEKENKTARMNENISQLDRILKEESDISKQADQLISLITTSVNAAVGILYNINDKDEERDFFYPTASYGLFNSALLTTKVYLGEGTLGEAGRTKTLAVLNDIPEGYLTVHSGLGSFAATHIIIIPLVFKNGLYGALEFGRFKPFEKHEILHLEQMAESIASHFFKEKLVNADATRKLEELAQKQAEELIEIHTLQRATYEKLEMQLREVEMEKHKNEAILEGCVDGVISFDEAGRIHFCNKEAQNIIDSTREEILQKNITKLFPIQIESSGKEWNCFYNQGDQKKEISIRSEIMIQDTFGQPVDVLVTSTQVKVQETILFTFFIQKISVDLF